MSPRSFASLFVVQLPEVVTPADAQCHRRASLPVHPYLRILTPPLTRSCPSYGSDGGRCAYPLRTRTRGVSSFLLNSTDDLVDFAVLRRLSFVVSPGRPRSALTIARSRVHTIGIVSAITLRLRKKYIYHRLFT